MVNRLRALVFLLICMLLTTGCGRIALDTSLSYSYPTKAVLSYNGKTLQSAQPQYGTMELVAQKGYVAMYADMGSGDIAIMDLRNGQVYTTVPANAASDTTAVGVYKNRLQSALITTDVDPSVGVSKDKYSYTGTERDTAKKVRRTDDGVLVWYTFQEERYAIPVEYLLTEDGFYVRVRTEQIVEQGTEKLYELSLLPYFAAQGSQDDGYLLLPDGSGALIYFSSEKQNYASYSGKLFGDNYLTVDDYSGNRQENCLLPIYGIQTKTGSVLAIAESGAAYATVNAYVDGQLSGYNTAYFSFAVRNRQTSLIGNPSAFHSTTVNVFEEGNIAVGDISVRYILLDSTTENGIGQMAHAMRQYLLQKTDGAVSSNSNTSFVISTIGGYEKATSVLGFRMNTVCPVTTFEEAASMVKGLQKKGMSNFSLLYDGYDKMALAGKLSDRISISSVVGNTKQIQTLSSLLGEGRLYLTASAVNFHKNSTLVQAKKNATRDIGLKQCALKNYQRNTFHPDTDTEDTYLANVHTATQMLLGKASSLSQADDRVGLAVTDYASMLYEDYSVNGSRRAYGAQTVQNTLQTIAAPIAAENANLYAALYSDVLFNIPSYSSGYDILDVSVPFYQMVFSGIKQTVSRPINTYGNPEEAFLQCLRCGMLPHYELVEATSSEMKENNLESYYAASTENWTKDILEHYKRFVPVYDKTSGQTIQNIRFVDDGVTATVYENGVTVWVNTSDTAYISDMITVPASDFVLVS